MKFTTGLFLVGAVFYILVGVIYWLVSHDEAGTTVILLTGGLAGMIGFYLRNHSVHVNPEDDPAGLIEHADPDYGHFSPHSWAPLLVGASAALTFLGLGIASWLLLLGLVAVIMSTAYWTFEYYIGTTKQF